MVKIPAVLDCACLIGLERIGRLDLLPALLEPIAAPPAVIQEFGSRPAWITEVTPSDRGMIAALRLIVDLGEAEAITLSYEKGARLIIDWIISLSLVPILKNSNKIALLRLR